MTTFLTSGALPFAATLRPTPMAGAGVSGAQGPWAWALALVGGTPAGDARAAAASVPASTAPPVSALATSKPAVVAAAARTTGGTRRLAPSGSARRSAIPAAASGSAVTTAAVARGMATYRQAVVRAGAAPRTIRVPATSGAGAARVEVFAVQPHRSGRHATQVLVPVSGDTVTVPAGAEVRFLVRATGLRTGTATIDAGVAKLRVQVADASVRALPMLAWVNPSSATARGASVAQVESTLAQFGVASSGGAAAAVGRQGMPRRYVSAAWEAATRQPIGPVVDRILAQERALAASAPGTSVWVQVSDEQDTTAAAAARTTRWIAQLDAELARRGSKAKLFAACQPRPHVLGYARHLDGWAVTQSSAGQSRSESILAVRQAAQRAGRRIELMEYPGNAFFDGATPGSAALSTASAALDGAGSWFLYSANNLDVLESGRGVEGRGDIGGLVAIRRGEVLPTLALAEADYGANIGAAARALGGDARTGAAASAVRAAARSLDDYRRGPAADLAAWERSVGTALVSRFG